MTLKTAPLEIISLANEMVEMLAANACDNARVLQIEVRANYLSSLQNANRAYCKMVMFLGAYARGDRMAAEKSVAEAVADVGANSEIVQNSIVVLAAMGSLRAAMELIDRMMTAFPNDKELAYSAIIHLQLCLQLSRCVEFIPYYEKLALNDSLGKWAIVKASIMSSHTLLKESKFSDADLVERLSAAIDVIRMSGREVLRQSRYTLHDGTFVSELYIDADPTTCASMNFMIADALVEQFEDTGSDIFSIACRPLGDFTITSTFGW